MLQKLLAHWEDVVHAVQMGAPLELEALPVALEPLAVTPLEAAWVVLPPVEEPEEPVVAVEL